MAITMSGATVETGMREDLLASNVDTSVVSGGATANTQRTGGFLWFGGEESATGAALAGITASFAKNVGNAIEEYSKEIQDKLNKLEAVASDSAFQGESVQQSLARFIESVRNVGTSYIAKLSAAEAEIIASVDAAYSTQDSDLSGSLSGDANTLENQ